MQLPDIKQRILFKNMQRSFSWFTHLTSWIMIQLIFSKLIGCSFTISLMAKQTAFAPCAIVFLCHYKAFLESLTHWVDCEGHTLIRFQWHNLALSLSVNTCIYFALLFSHTGCLLNVSGSNSSWVWTKKYRRSPAGTWVTGCMTVAVQVHSDQLHINGPISQEGALSNETFHQEPWNFIRRSWKQRSTKNLPLSFERNRVKAPPCLKKKKKKRDGSKSHLHSINKSGPSLGFKP